MINSSLALTQNALDWLFHWVGLISIVFEPRHEISNNLICTTSIRLRPACAYAQSDQSLCLSLEYSMTVKLLTENHLEFQEWCYFENYIGPDQISRPQKKPTDRDPHCLPLLWQAYANKLERCRWTGYDLCEKSSKDSCLAWQRLRAIHLIELPGRTYKLCNPGLFLCYIRKSLFAGQTRGNLRVPTGVPEMGWHSKFDLLKCHPMKWKAPMILLKKADHYYGNRSTYFSRVLAFAGCILL